MVLFCEVGTLIGMRGPANTYSVMMSLRIRIGKAMVMDSCMRGSNNREMEDVETMTGVVCVETYYDTYMIGYLIKRGR